ncbi:glycosyltransferase [Lactiplantibacillus plantarum]|uniref:glycosyltransferase n=1 Tax=Lactiplantibacillus plantarum TaxID=1590 RepID=UPI002855182D|nr:glycosyltransferase [Lactiplantibacillus plantarum]MDR7677590.1 glycosyltransferase [Lactiplantibacillus plantarum]
MRILVVGDFLKTSGMTRYIFNVIGRIHASDFQVDALSISGKDECKGQVKKMGWGFYCVQAANNNLLRHLVQSFIFFKKHAKDYDVIHFNESALWNFLPIIFAHLFGAKRIILNSHNTYFATEGSKKLYVVLEIMHRIGKWLVAHVVAQNIAVSEEAARWMFTRKAINRHEYKIIVNGIELEKFAYNKEQRFKIRKSLKINEDTFLFGNVGIFNARKNQLRLLEIFNELVKRNLDVKLVLVGDGPIKEAIVAKISELRLADKVVMTGLINNTNEYYQAMDGVIMPSLNEGLSTVLLEAQTSGLQFILSEGLPLGNHIDLLVHEVPLSESNRVWADVVEHNMNREKREVFGSIMQKKGFDVELSAKELYQTYLEER